MCPCDTHTLVVLAWSGAKGPKVYYVGTTQGGKKVPKIDGLIARADE